MPTPIDPKRLPRLRAALKRFKPGEMVPQQDLAKLYGVSNARLTTLIHQRFEQFPSAERHGDKTHWYEAAPAIQAMIAYLTASTKSRRAAAQRAARVLGEVQSEAKQEAETEEFTPPTPAELDKLASAATRTFRLEQEKGMFLRKAHATAFIRDLFNTVQRHVSALPLEIDPNGELPPLHRARLESATRDAMVRIHGSVADLIGDAGSL